MDPFRGVSKTRRGFGYVFYGLLDPIPLSSSLSDRENMAPSIARGPGVEQPPAIKGIHGSDGGSAGEGFYQSHSAPVTRQSSRVEEWIRSENLPLAPLSPALTMTSDYDTAPPSPNLNNLNRSLDLSGSSYDHSFDLAASEGECAPVQPLQPWSTSDDVTPSLGQIPETMPLLNQFQQLDISEHISSSTPAADQFNFEDTGNFAPAAAPLLMMDPQGNVIPVIVQGPYGPEVVIAQSQQPVVFNPAVPPPSMVFSPAQQVVSPAPSLPMPAPTQQYRVEDFHHGATPSPAGTAGSRALVPSTSSGYSSGCSTPAQGAAGTTVGAVIGQTVIFATSPHSKSEENQIQLPGMSNPVSITMQ